MAEEQLELPRLRRIGGLAPLHVSTDREPWSSGLGLQLRRIG